MSAELEQCGVGTIALAGFMRVLSPWFVEQWRGAYSPRQAMEV